MPLSKSEKPTITVANFAKLAPAELELKILAGEQSFENRRISSPRLQKLGLALAGFSKYIHAGRVQLVGQSEIWFLSQLEKADRISAIKKLDPDNICVILITKGLEPPAELIEIAEECGLPILQTSLVSSEATGVVLRFLTELLAPETSLHGVLLGMYGLGVMILGDSGVGKSECALDLISRGHALVSDDRLNVKRLGDKLIGAAPELTYGHLEIRGLGIINVKEIFGVNALGKKKKTIDLCIELRKWEKNEEIERLGLDTNYEEIFGVKLIKYILPVSPGRNTAILVETAIRVYLLRLSGYDAAQELVKKHNEILQFESRTVSR